MKKYLSLIVIIVSLFAISACVLKVTNKPPTAPHTPSPADKATEISVTPTLSWSASDPDGDTLTYDLFFGTSESHLDPEAGDLTENEYTFTEKLEYNTTYYWKVKAKDGKGGEKEGPVWSFTTQTSEQPPNTPPTAPHNPSPADKATGISVTPTLSWEAEDPDGDPLTYDLFFGTSESQLTLKAGDLTENKYTFTEKLEYNTTYYWKVKAKDGKGGEKEGPVWSFTTKSELIVESLVFKPHSIYVNEETKIRFMIAIPDSLSFDEINVELIRVDKNGEIIEVIGNLYDNGDVNVGDDIALDGIFSGQFTFNEPKEGFIRVRVLIEAIKEEEVINYSSEIYDIKIIEKITLEESNEIFEQVKEIIDESIEKIDVEELKSNLINWIEEQPSVTDLIVTQDSIYYELGENFRFNILFVEEDFLGNGNGIDLASFKVKNQPLNTKRELTTSQDFDNNVLNVTLLEEKKAIILEPFEWQFPSLAGIQQTKNLLKANDYEVIEYKNDEVSVNKFLDLRNFDLVILVTHGATTGFCTGELYNYEKAINYQENGLLNIDTGIVVSVKKVGSSKKPIKYEAYFLITPFFIENYMKLKPGSLFFLNACSALGDEFIINAFKNKGCRAVLGYDNKINIEDANNIIKSFFENLLEEGLSTVESYINTINEIGEIKYDNDSETWTTNFIMNSRAEILNGGFEEGAVDEAIEYWYNIGDCRKIIKLGPLTPLEENYMGIISTGLGSVSDSNSFLAQSFYVSENYNIMTFWYNVVSEEPMEWVGSSYDDTFEVNVYNEKGEMERIVFESINTSEWSPIDGIDFYGGDSTTYMTGWKKS